jgi:hypothetical protein
VEPSEFFPDPSVFDSPDPSVFGPGPEPAELIECDEPVDDGSQLVAIKWTADGASSLAEAAAKLRARADEFDQMRAEGWTLSCQVDDGFVHVTPPASAAVYGAVLCNPVR